jgi:hypothetical protein
MKRQPENKIYLTSLENRNPLGENVLHFFALNLVRSDKFIPNCALQAVTETYADFLEITLSLF